LQTVRKCIFPPPVGAEEKKDTFDFISFFKKHLLNAANTVPRMVLWKEEERYMRYGLCFQIPGEEFRG
jgi:hypothetical protein